MQAFRPASIDYFHPWYASVRAAGWRLSGAASWLEEANLQCQAGQLTNHRGQPLSFVAQAALPEGVPYETFISTAGAIPTRNNAHDLFNALVWLSFPKIKRQLNAMQARHIERAGISGARGAARDAVTIFDENAALLVVSDTAEGRTLVAALREHRWQAAFVAQRASFGREAEVWTFGHALMEKLLAPYKATTAHAWVVVVEQDYFAQPEEVRRAWIDDHVAEELASMDAGSFSTARFTPLPVSGVPGWWSAQDEAFYADEAVFRPQRRSSSARRSGGQRWPATDRE